MLVKMSLGLAGKKTLMSERLKKFKKKCTLNKQCRQTDETAHWTHLPRAESYQWQS